MKPHLRCLWPCVVPLVRGGKVGGAKRRAAMIGLWPHGLILTAIVLWGASVARAAHQTASFSPIYDSDHLPFRIRVEQVGAGSAALPTLHSYVVAVWEDQWIFLGGRTNGLHGMTGQGAFPTASANGEVWVVDRAGGHSWRRPLAEAGLPAGLVDFLSATNHNFVQEDRLLYVVGGYGFDRAAADYVTFSQFAEIDVPGLMAWVKRDPAAPSPTTFIQTIASPLFQVTGGALEKSGDGFLLIFGQNYPGRYRPNFNGTYTRQVRRFDLLGTGPALALDPASVSQSPPQDDFRRRDLNVVPVLRRDEASGRLDDEVLALAGVFTPTTGVWTVPVTISAAGVPSQPDPLAATTFKQGLHHYHSAKTTVFDRVTGENFILQFGGLSAQFQEASGGTWVSDPLVPFVHHLSCLVRSPAGEFHQTLLPSEFPDLRSPDGARLFFGTNAEFLPAPTTPLLRPKIIDLAALGSPQVIGHIYGGLVSDAPNNGNTRAGADIFAVILEPRPDPAPPLDIAFTAPGTVTLSWADPAGASQLFEQSTDLQTWTELWPPPDASPLILSTAGEPETFFRLLQSRTTLPPQ
jgi:hypothetical protein